MQGLTEEEEITGVCHWGKAIVINYCQVLLPLTETVKVDWSTHMILYIFTSINVHGETVHFQFPVKYYLCEV